MCSDKADIPSAIVIEMLYSTCIWETGKVKVFYLICHIISFDVMNIGKGGALNRGLKLIKQLIMVLGCILERHIRQRVEIDEMQCRFMSGNGGIKINISGRELRLTRCSADLCQAMVALQLRSSF